MVKVIIPDTNFFIRKEGYRLDLDEFKEQEFLFIIPKITQQELLKEIEKIKNRFIEIKVDVKYLEEELSLDNFLDIKEKALRKEAPFRKDADSDPGFKDAIMWEEIKKISTSEEDQLYFISKDKGFVDEPNKSALEKEFLKQNNKKIKILKLGEHREEFNFIKINNSEKEKIYEIISEKENLKVKGYLYDYLIKNKDALSDDLVYEKPLTAYFNVFKKDPFYPWFQMPQSRDIRRYVFFEKIPEIKREKIHILKRKDTNKFKIRIDFTIKFTVRDTGQSNFLPNLADLSSMQSIDFSKNEIESKDKLFYQKEAELSVIVEVDVEKDFVEFEEIEFDFLAL
jgi:hypothetical protein